MQGQMVRADTPDARVKELDLLELWQILWRGKLLIMFITGCFSFAAVMYALSLPNVYRSSALLAPSSESQGGGLSAMANQFGGLASLAGINVGQAGDGKVTMAIEVIKSRSFAQRMIDKYDLMVPLMAAEGWDPQSGELLINPKKYDESQQKWVRKVSGDVTAPEPTLLEAYGEFSKLLAVHKGKKTGFITVSVDHFSPEVAKNWVEWVVAEVNLVMKERDVKEATKSIVYLTEQLGNTALTDMKAVFYQLIEEQTKTIMLAEVREEYVFSILDSAYVPEKKTSPKRALISLLGMFLGGSFAMFIVLAKSIFGYAYKLKKVVV